MIGGGGRLLRGGGGEGALIPLKDASAAGEEADNA